MIEVACNLCGKDDWQVLYPATNRNVEEPDVRTFRCTSPHYGSHPQIVKCNNCDLVYANPRLTAEELVSLYTAVEDETYVDEREGRELTFARHLNALQEYTGLANDRSLLDVGAYIGIFVEIACANGWRAEGIEPSAWAVAQAQARGLPVHQGTQQASILTGREFDVLTMWDVIEHVTDPSAELRLAYQLLRPGGWLAVHTMDIDSLTARLMGRRWPWFMEMHLYYFSQETLAELIRRNGFDVVWSGAQGRYLRLRYLASRLAGLNRPLGSAATSIVNRFGLGHLTVPLNFGDLITVYARKPA